MHTIIRTSERATFERCKAQWWWAWREGLVHRTRRQDALWFGEGVHLAFARWYTGPGTARGVEPAETWEEWAREGLASVKTMFDTEDEERIARYEDAAELGRVMLEGYRRLYGRDDHMSIVQPEHSWHLDMPWPSWQQIWETEPGDIMARLVGTYDNVYLDLRSGDYWLREHKTAAQISLRHLSLDNQAGTYWATAANELRRRGVLKKQQTIRGIEYDFLRKALPDDRPRDAEGYATNKPTKEHYAAALEEHTGRPDADGKPWMKLSLPALQTTAEHAGLVVLGERSKVQPPPLYLRHQVIRTRAENRAQLLRAQDQAMEMELYRRGLLRVTKNPTRECNFCAFYDMCELQERGGDWETFRDLSYRAEDPYSNHRIKSASE